MADVILLGDCLDVMPQLPAKSIDMILCDLPYGTTEAPWDRPLPLDLLWSEYRRLLKGNGVIVLTSVEPFTSILNMSNLSWFKYDFIWNKVNATGHLNAKARPLKQHEHISIFSEGVATSTKLTMCYNPQGLSDVNTTKVNFRTETTGERQSRTPGSTWKQSKSGYPKSILTFIYDKKRLHPTQKPVALFEYLIKTYTNPGDLVLDNAIGSGTTAVACINTGRHFIGIELNPDYYTAALMRISTNPSGT